MPLDSTNFEPTLLDDLCGAKAYIAQHGWCQRQSRNGTKVCMLGAIYEMTGGDSQVDWPRRHDACTALQHALGLEDFSEVVAWQDRPGRTVEEILKVYDLAIRANQ